MFAFGALANTTSLFYRFGKVLLSLEFIRPYLHKPGWALADDQLQVTAKVSSLQAPKPAAPKHARALATTRLLDHRVACMLGQAHVHCVLGPGIITSRK